MAFTVETGSGISGANSLVSLAEADAYWTDRNSTAWLALTDTQKQAALIAASEYLSGFLAWIGIKSNPNQILAWPRAVYFDSSGLIAVSIDVVNSRLVDYTGVPVLVRQATIRVAHAVGVAGVDLFGSVSPDAGVKRVKAGSVEVEFDERAVSIGLNGRPDFPWLMDMLRLFVDGGGQSASVNRRVARV